jgi:uncharacterized membrane protein (GlpM family)
MGRFLFKTLISALVISGVSELGKRSTAAAAVLASLPLTSLMAILWLYSDTRDPERAARLSVGIFWAVVPSLVFLASLAFLLRSAIRFPVALTGSIVLTAATYFIYIALLAKAGIRL